MSTKWMSLEDVIKEYGFFRMYFQTRPCQIGTMLGGCKRQRNQSYVEIGSH
jgi:hypothetical protein